MESLLHWWIASLQPEVRLPVRTIPFFLTARNTFITSTPDDAVAKSVGTAGSWTQGTYTWFPGFNSQQFTRQALPPAKPQYPYCFVYLIHQWKRSHVAWPDHVLSYQNWRLKEFQLSRLLTLYNLLMWLEHCLFCELDSHYDSPSHSTPLSSGEMLQQMIGKTTKEVCSNMTYFSWSFKQSLKHTLINLYSWQQDSNLRGETPMDF